MNITDQITNGIAAINNLAQAINNLAQAKGSQTVIAAVETTVADTPNTPAAKVTKIVTETKPATAEDCRKFGGYLIEKDNADGFKKCLNGHKNITVYQTEGGDLNQLLADLEAEAGVKLADLPA